MPIYTFQNPVSLEIIEVHQSMQEKHEYIDPNGLKWNRVFTLPSAQTKGKPLDLRSKKDAELYNNVYKKRYEHNISKNKIDPKTGKER